MSMIPRCVICDAPVRNVYAPTPCCEGQTCPKERDELTDKVMRDLRFQLEMQRKDKAA
jgi:hypothetical protein